MISSPAIASIAASRSSASSGSASSAAAQSQGQQADISRRAEGVDTGRRQREADAGGDPVGIGVRVVPRRRRDLAVAPRASGHGLDGHDPDIAAHSSEQRLGVGAVDGIGPHPRVDRET